MSSTAELHRERAFLLDKIAAKEHDPEARLVEIEEQLEERRAEEARRHAEKAARYRTLVTDFVAKREIALQKLQEFLAADAQAKEARDAAYGAPGLPEKIAVTAARGTAVVYGGTGQTPEQKNLREMLQRLKSPHTGDW